MKTIVLLPTYNEAANLDPLSRAIFSRLPDTHILVIDDGSTDGTRQVADRLSEEYPSQFFSHYRERKEGLGRAYVAGFQWTLKRDYDFIFQMDADFSHSPSYLPRLLERARTSDLVIGSRYAAGGKDRRAQLSRRLLSRLGNFYACSLLSLEVADATGGFKCFRRHAIESLDLNAFTSDGFLFQVEVNYLLAQTGFRIDEIPIVFEERKTGFSKMSLGIVWEALWKILQMKNSSLRRKNAAVLEEIE